MLTIHEDVYRFLTIGRNPKNALKLNPGRFDVSMRQLSGWNAVSSGLALLS